MWTIFPQNPGKLTERVRNGKQQASGNPEACEPNYINVTLE